MPATKQILTREDLDSALSQALQQALTEASDRLSAEVRGALSTAVDDIKAACESRSSSSKPDQPKRLSQTLREEERLFGQTLNVTPNRSRELVINAGAASSGSADGYASVPDTEITHEALLASPRYYSNSRDNQVPKKSSQFQSAAMKKLTKFSAEQSSIQFGWTLTTLVTHPGFEKAAGCLVALNCVALGCETNLACLNHGTMPESMKPLVGLVELVFCLLFSTEIGCRIAVHGCRFFTMEGWQWNCFDAVIVLFQVLEQVINVICFISQSTSFERVALHVALFFRLTRILRIVRLLHLFRELQVRILSIIESLSSMFSTLALLFMMNYACSVFFVICTMEASAQEENAELASLFGNLPRTSLTLLECIIGGLNWDRPLNLLLDDAGLYAVAFFLFYICFGVFVLLNVIMGVFIDKAIKIAQDETELEIACAITGAFVGDKGYGGEEITWEIFEEKLEGRELQQCFNILGVDIADARSLFELIDTDKSGSVDAQEIVEGCLKLKGTAKALDMSLMLQILNQVTERLDEHVEEMGHRVNKVDRNLTRLCNTLKVPIGAFK
jgi:hypothetical protein